MSKTCNIKIDNVSFKAPEGMNIIDAAALAGIHIPNLCYLKGMKGIGACRLCLVEVEGAKGPVIACNTKVKEGMEIQTKTPEIEEQRKFIIDLIVSMHPLDCMTCTKGGVCNLQKYAYDFDIKESSFTRKQFGYPVDVANPFIKMSPDYCVLCGRCVRVCKEQGTNVLEFMGRGVGAKVSTVVDRSLHESDCTFCGSCIDACPVNAIIESDRSRKGREWDYEKTNSVCTLCGNACDIVVSTKNGQIQKINGASDPDTPLKYLCAYGRFSQDFLETDARITTPMKRVNNELVETTWSDALKIVAEKLDAMGKDAGFVSTASIANEDLLTLKEFAEDAVGTRHFDSTMSLYADKDSLVNSDSASLKTADLIVLVGINPSQRLRILPALNVAIRRFVARGAKLLVINADHTKLDKTANHKLEGNEVDSIKSLMKAVLDKTEGADKKLKDAVKDASVTEDIEKAAELFLSAKNPIIYTSPALYDPASNLSLLKGNTIAVTYESNAKGAALMGMVSKGKSFKEMVSEGMPMLYVVGSVPIHSRPKTTEFLVVQDSHFSDIAKQADIFLPTVTYLETSGTIVDFKGRIRHIPKLIDSIGNSKPHREIFLKLAKNLDATLKRPTEAEIKKKLKVKKKAGLRPFAKKEGMDVLPQMIIDAVNVPLISAPRLFWLKENEKAVATRISVS